LVADHNSRLLAFLLEDLPRQFSAGRRGDIKELLEYLFEVLAGLVFIIQADGRFLSKGMAMLGKKWLYGGSDYVTGVAGWVFLIVAVFAIRFIITRKGWKVG